MSTPDATDDADGDYDTSLITSTAFESYHFETGAVSSGPGYVTSRDLAQSSSFQVICWGTGNASDESCAGVLHLFNPASTTYVKHFYSRVI